MDQPGGKKLSDFGKWWSDPKKHFKRLNHWLPHLRQTAANLNGHRGIRYFTLCARPMIDVFMLVADNILKIDEVGHTIRGVKFCECVPDHYIEIREMMAREDAGFFGKLEDVALFTDDAFTETFKTLDEISMALEEDEARPEDEIERLQKKRIFHFFQTSFPYDYINLDFCQYYYPQPPDVFRINETVGRFLEWQRNESSDAQPVAVSDFILAVTCRHDSLFPKEAEDFLLGLVTENYDASTEYREQLRSSRSVEAVDDWLKKDREDFFLAAWPKDVARLAKERGWKTEILDYVYYQRPADESVPYIIVCLVLRFSLEVTTPDYLPAALFALDQQNRKLIGEIDPKSTEGIELKRSLEGILIIRNDQARRVNQVELPEPE
jgi:hypothetical protein